MNIPILEASDSAKPRPLPHARTSQARQIGRLFLLIAIAASHSSVFANDANPHPQDAAAEGILQELAACAFAEPPVIMEGKSLSSSAMQTMQNAVRDYSIAMQESLSCIETTERNSTASMTPPVQATIDAIYNNGVDQLNFIVEEYNKQVEAHRIGRRMPEIPPIPVPSH